MELTRTVELISSLGSSSSLWSFGFLDFHFWYLLIGSTKIEVFFAFLMNLWRNRSLKIKTLHRNNSFRNYLCGGSISRIFIETRVDKVSKILKKYLYKPVDLEMTTFWEFRSKLRWIIIRNVHDNFHWMFICMWRFPFC